MAKKDDGIIPELFGLSEETRDKLAKRDWTKRQRDPADNPDNWTTADCIKNKWSGFRHNTFTNKIEIWLGGMLKKEMDAAEAATHPERFASMWEEVIQGPAIITGEIADEVGPVKKH